MTAEEAQWVGEWFYALEELGEYPYSHFGRVDHRSGEVRWTLLHHRDFDAYGGFCHVIRSEGAAFEMPLPPPRPQASWLTKLVGLVRYIRESRLRSTEWIAYDRNLPPYERAPQYHLFTEAETATIKARAKAQGISPQFHSLYHLNRVIAQHLLKPEQRDNWWMIPVNMRGAVVETPNWHNYSTYISTQIAPDTQPQEIQAQIRTRLVRQLHWAAWTFMLAGKWFGKKGIRKSLRYYRENDHCWVGGHTFVEFDLRRVTGNDPTYCDRYSWTGTPPVTRSHPIAATGIISNGRLALALNAHPGLVHDPALLRSLLMEWARAL